MSNFSNETFKNYDSYATPDYVWKNIKDYIPKNKTIWEPFYCQNSDSSTVLQKLSCKKVIYKNIDFFKHNFGECVISNPPFSKKSEVLENILKEYCLKRNLFNPAHPSPNIFIGKLQVRMKQYYNNLYKDTNRFIE